MMMMMIKGQLRFPDGRGGPHQKKIMRGKNSSQGIVNHGLISSLKGQALTVWHAIYHSNNDAMNEPQYYRDKLLASAMGRGTCVPLTPPPPSKSAFFSGVGITGCVPWQWNVADRLKFYIPTLVTCFYTAPLLILLLVLSSIIIMITIKRWSS